MNELLLRFLKEKVDEFISGRGTIPEIAGITLTLYYCNLLDGHYNKVHREIAKWKKVGYYPEISDIEKWFRES